MPDTPTVDDVLRALGELRAALVAEAEARVLAAAKTEAFEAVYTAFRGQGPSLSGEGVARVVGQLQAHAARLEEIAAKPEQRRQFTVTVPQDLQDVLDKIDADTTAVAAVVMGLRDQISTGMTPADVEAVRGKLAEIASRLEATAADPNQPVPPGPPPAP
jgi:hypothetical protein